MHGGTRIQVFQVLGCWHPRVEFILCNYSADMFFSAGGSPYITHISGNANVNSQT